MAIPEWRLRSRGKRGDGLGQQELVRLLERIGKGVGRGDHRLDEARAGEGKRASVHGRAAVVLRRCDQRIAMHSSRQKPAYPYG